MNEIQDIFLCVSTDIFKSHYRASLNFHRSESHSGPIEFLHRPFKKAYVPYNIKGFPLTSKYANILGRSGPSNRIAIFPTEALS